MSKKNKSEQNAAPAGADTSRKVTSKPPAPQKKVKLPEAEPQIRDKKDESIQGSQRYPAYLIPDYTLEENPKIYAQQQYDAFKANPEKYRISNDHNNSLPIPPEVGVLSEATELSKVKKFLPAMGVGAGVHILDKLLDEQEKKQMRDFLLNTEAGQALTKYNRERMEKYARETDDAYKRNIAGLKNVFKDGFSREKLEEFGYLLLEHEKLLESSLGLEMYKDMEESGAIKQYFTGMLSSLPEISKDMGGLAGYGLNLAKDIKQNKTIRKAEEVGYENLSESAQNYLNTLAIAEDVKGRVDPNLTLVQQVGEGTLPLAKDIALAMVGIPPKAQLAMDAAELPQKVTKEKRGDILYREDAETGETRYAGEANGKTLFEAVSNVMLDEAVNKLQGKAIDKLPGSDAFSTAGKEIVKSAANGMWEGESSVSTGRENEFVEFKEYFPELTEGQIAAVMRLINPLHKGTYGTLPDVDSKYLPEKQDIIRKDAVDVNIKEPLQAIHQKKDHVENARIEKVVNKAPEIPESLFNDEMGGFVKVSIAGVPVQLLQGRVVQNPDGTIDAELSDRKLYYAAPDGRIQVATPEQINSIEENITLEQLYDDSWQPAQALPAQPELNTVPDDSEPEVYQIGNGLSATFLNDGKYLINKEYNTRQSPESEQLINSLNEEYADNGLVFTLEELPKQQSRNPFEKKRWGIVAQPAPVNENVIHNESFVVHYDNDETTPEVNQIITPEAQSVANPAPDNIDLIALAMQGMKNADAGNTGKEPVVLENAIGRESEDISDK